jgi:hypothetical protein
VAFNVYLNFSEKFKYYWQFRNSNQYAGAYPEIDNFTLNMVHINIRAAFFPAPAQRLADPNVPSRDSGALQKSRNGTHAPVRRCRDAPEKLVFSQIKP